MDFGTLLGLLSGFTIIVIGILGSGGDLVWFANGISILIVVGGTFAATMVNLPLRAVGDIFKILKNAFTGEDFDYEGTIEEIVDKAQKARKDGLLSLEADLSNMNEGFFKNGIELAINERESSRLRTFLNLEMNNISSRHIAGQELFLYMGSYAPAFGMLGTVLGLIVMMNNFATGGGEEASASYDVAEKFAELSEIGTHLNLKIGLSLGDREGENTNINNADIIICTSEKFDSLMRNKPELLQGLSVIVADEVHLIHDSSRGPTMEVNLTRFLHSKKHVQLIALSATIIS